jgi:lipopolysaccharide biosynthesis glycosyltransferase
MNCVFTIAIGEPFQKMAEISLKSTRAYAAKVGADFVLADSLTIGHDRSAHWEKMRIYDLLGKYARVLYVDADVIIRDTCPNLFTIVPAAELGIFDQVPYSMPASVEWNKNIIKAAARAIGIQLPHEKVTTVYNSGLMVLSKKHRAIFDYSHIDEIPGTTATDHYVLHEQPYLDVKILTGGYKVHVLDCRFNFMVCFSMFTKEQFDAAHVIHYASNSPNCALCRGQLYADMCRVNARGDCKHVPR